MEEIIAGIDLGTTFSSCGFFKVNIPDVLAFSDGYREQASWCYIDNSNEVCGNAAKNNSVACPELAMYDSKRLITKTYGEIVKDVINYVNVANENGKIIYVLKSQEKNVDKTFTPENVHEMLLKFLKHRIDDYLSQEVKRAVIGIPATFNKNQREATLKAALFDTIKTKELGGVYESVKLIKEPVAVAISYIYDVSNPINVPNKSKILVYDFGGGTFDLALIEYDNGYLNVLATDGDSKLGGQDITYAIFKEFESKFGKELDKNNSRAKKNKGKLLKKCNAAKELFVDPSVADQQIFVSDESDNTHKFTYALFCKIADPFIDKTLNITKDFLKKHSVTPYELFKVILTGGSSKMRNVKPKLDAVFGESRVTVNKTPVYDVVNGTILYGYKFMQKETLAPIGIRATRDKKKCFIEIIPVGTKWGEEITISGVNDNKAPDALFRFYEYDISEENYLGKLILPFNSKDKNKKINSILVTLKVKINENGDLQATASYEDGGEATTIIHLFKTREDFE